MCTYLVVLIKGKTFGMTDYVNPKDHEEPIEQVLVKMTNGGVDHALECCGIPSCIVKIFKLPFCIKVHRTSEFSTLKCRNRLLRRADQVVVL